MPNETTAQFLHALGFISPQQQESFVHLATSVFDGVQRFYRAVIPAPKIVAPLSNAIAIAGRPLKVSIETNRPGVLHRLRVLPNSHAGHPAAPVALTFTPPDEDPFEVTVDVPGVHSSGAATSFFLEVGIDPSVGVLTQQQHTTTLRVTSPIITASMAIGASVAAGTAVTFTITLGGGTAPYSYTFVPAPGTFPSASGLAAGSVAVAHAYNTPGTYTAIIAVKDANNIVTTDSYGPLTFT